MNIKIWNIVEIIQNNIKICHFKNRINPSHQNLKIFWKYGIFWYILIFWLILTIFHILIFHFYFIFVFWNSEKSARRSADQPLLRTHRPRCRWGGCKPYPTSRREFARSLSVGKQSTIKPAYDGQGTPLLELRGLSSFLIHSDRMRTEFWWFLAVAAFRRKSDLNNSMEATRNRSSFSPER